MAGARFLFVLALASAMLAGCDQPLATPEPVYLRAAGSMLMGPLVDEMAQGFGEKSPVVTIEVSGLEPYGGLGTRYGLDALRKGETDLALASWLPPLASQSTPLGAALDPGWRTVAIARDGIAIIVHPDNPIQGLGLLQLRDLFNGRSDEWRAVGGTVSQGVVQPVSREAGSGTRAAFEALVMEDLDVTARALVAPTGQGVIDNVTRNKQAIGYVSMGEVTSSVKVLRIEGELPAAEMVRKGIYALSRDLWLVTTAEPSGPLQDFVDFALSPAGQQIVQGHAARIR